MPSTGLRRSVLLAVLAAAACRPAPPASFASADGLRLEYTARGDLQSGSAAVLEQIVADAEQATDVIVMSHGWWNNASTAECRYRAMIAGLRRNRPTAVAERDFRLLFVGIYWPSAVFPVEEATCTGVSAPRDETLETSRAPERAADSDALRTWMATAFPGSRQQEREHVTALLARSAAGEALTTAESTDLAATLARWRDAETPPDAAGEGPVDDPFAGDPADVAARWTRAELETSENERFRPTDWLGFANAFTFWTMKDRAGVVGSRGVFDLVRRLQPLRQRGVRVHLVGHSFGSKLVSAALTGHGGRGAPNVVDSLVLLQGALTHFAFATADEITRVGVATPRGGLYAPIVTERLVTGVVAATYSTYDDKNRYYYPAAVRLSDDFLEVDRVSKFGSLGANGILGAPAEHTTYVPGQPLILTRAVTRLFSVDASAVVKGHSDIVNDDVAKLMWAALDAR